MQKAYQEASGAIPTVPNANSVPALHLDPGLEPINTDSDDGSVSPSEEKPRSLLHGEHHKHIKPEKLASFLRSLLGIADDSKENDSFISDVVKSVVKNGNEKEMEIVCPIPVCVLKSMLKTAVFNPSSVPVSKVSVIDGKEVVRIGDHPQLKPFFERVKKGEDVEAVKKDMVSEGLDGEVLLKDPNTVVLLDDYTISFIRADKAKPVMEPASPLHAASSSFKDEDSVLLAEDPTYSKYVKMLTRKIPREAVLDCMKKDGVDASVLDKLISGVEKKSGEKKSVVKKMVKLCDHPKYAKYFNMLKKGVPLPGVRHAMMRDGIDASVLDKDPNEEVELEEEKKDEVKKVKMCEQTKYAKYFNMLKKGLPDTAVRHAIMTDKEDSSVIDRDPNEEVELEEEKSEKKQTEEEDLSEFKPERIMRKVPLYQHPDYEQYFTLLDRHVPRVEVEYNMRKANKDVKVLDMDRNTLFEIEVTATWLSLCLGYLGSPLAASRLRQVLFHAEGRSAEEGCGEEHEGRWRDSCSTCATCRLNGSSWGTIGLVDGCWTRRVGLRRGREEQFGRSCTGTW